MPNSEYFAKPIKLITESRVLGLNGQTIEERCKNLLKGRRGELIENGFQEPAAVAFQMSDQRIGFLIYESSNPLASSEYIAALLPKGAKRISDEPVYGPAVVRYKGDAAVWASPHRTYTLEQ